MKGLKIGVAVEWVIQSAFINLQSSGVFSATYDWLISHVEHLDRCRDKRICHLNLIFFFSVNSGSYSEEYRIHKSILKAWQNWFGIMPDSGVLKNVSLLWRVCRLSTMYLLLSEGHGIAWLQQMVSIFTKSEHMYWRRTGLLTLFVLLEYFHLLSTYLCR